MLRRLSLVIFLSSPLGCLRPDGAKVAIAGEELYRACGTCHGDEGTGNPKLAAPNIAGLPAWYVEAQLVKYRSGWRGAHPDDTEGLRMRPMSRQLMDQDEVKAVATYISSLKAVKAAPTLQGDAVAGAGSYALCQACHGEKGQGNEAMKAPPLVGQADWYVVAQLKKFKGGLRGANPNDTTGTQMRGMAATLADEQAMKNVAAHISSFQR